MNESIQPGQHAAPREIKPAAKPDLSTLTRRAVSAEDPLRVLLAEDSPIVSERLVALIKRLGRPIRIETAATGTAAAQLFNEFQPDAAIVDIALPGMNGFDLLAAFKLMRPACLVVMLTTYSYPDFRENAVRLGADFFFSKVLEFERVADVLLALTAPQSAETVRTL